jgi:hypothetical protein
MRDGKISRVAAAWASTLLVLALVLLGTTSSAGAQSGSEFSARYLQFPTVPFGDAFYQCDASYPNFASNAPIVALALTDDNAGCWMTGSDGGVFTLGDASFYGSMGENTLAAPVVGMAVAPGGGGY